MDKILSEVTKAVTEESTAFEIDIKPTGKVHSLLQRMKILPKKKKYFVRPATMGTMMRISRIARTIELPPVTEANYREVNYEIAEKYSDALAEIVALAITNTRALPDKKLISFLLFNLTQKEMLTAVSIVLMALDTQSFISTIASIRKLNILEEKEKKEKKASPQVPGKK